MDVYNLSFDELRQKIVQLQRNNFPDDHVSPTFMKEMVTVLDVRRHLIAMADATMSYAGATSLNAKFLLAENEQTAKNLQAARKKAKQPIGSSMVEIKKEILTEV